MESKPVTDCNTNTQSPFFRLPTELRNEIYKYVLTREDSLIPYNTARGGFSDFLLNLHSHHPMALIQVNRQIRTEAELMFYNKTQFTFDCAENLRRWLQGLSCTCIDSIGHIEMRTALSMRPFSGKLTTLSEAEHSVLRCRTRMRRSGEQEPRRVEIVQYQTGEKMLWLRGERAVIRVEAAQVV